MESERYQTMLHEVEGIVRELSGPDVDLDDMVAKVERGYSLIQKMGERLKVTRERIEELSKTFEQDEAEPSS